MDWFPWYFKDYRAATRHLTAEQDGIYRRLIDEYMDTRKPLPDNNYALARVAGVLEQCFTDARSILEAFFIVENGVWKHERCDLELSVQEAQSKFVVKRAKKAAEARWGKIKGKCYKHEASNANAMLNHATLTVTDTVIDKEVRSKKNPLTPKVSLRDLSVEHISEWLAKKRAEGKYINHDPAWVLECFKNYCEAKGRRYADYVAAYRGAFEWDKCQPSHQPNGSHNSAKPSWGSEGERLAEKYLREARPEGQSDTEPRLI